MSATLRKTLHITLSQRIIGKHRDHALRRHVLCKHAIDGEGEHVDALLLDLTAIGRCGPYDNVTDAQPSAVEQHLLVDPCRGLARQWQDAAPT